MTEKPITPEYYFRRQEIEAEIQAADVQILMLKNQKERLHFELMQIDQAIVNEQDEPTIEEPKEIEEEVKPKKLKKTND